MFILLVLIGYLIGSVPSGYLSMRLFTGSDIRALGTGNATITAVMIQGGRRPGFVALMLEIFKTAVCLVVAHYLVGEVWATLVILVAAVFGCNWSIWLKGKGGQGLTIGVFGLFLLNPLPTANCGGLLSTTYVDYQTTSSEQSAVPSLPPGNSGSMVRVLGMAPRRMPVCSAIVY